jgi:hypothetical protein
MNHRNHKTTITTHLFYLFVDSTMASTDPTPSADEQDPPSDQPTSTENDQSHSNDFVIREGFPALRLPGNKGPWIDGEEPLPRHSFWASENALTLHHLEDLWRDCETVFSARERESDQAYSAGVTYFCPSQMKPRCALEAMVLAIFRKHTDGLEEGIFIPEQSGAEWWTLVLDKDEEDHIPKEKHDNADNSGDEEEEDERDEVSFHFDADYGLEDQAPNLLLHPRLATVTYLTDFGAPTVVLDKRSNPPDDVDRKSLQGDIRKGWLSHPKLGKHMAFDGRLLHGAPASIFPNASDIIVVNNNSSEPPLKKAKMQRKRITLLVNIWLNHCPLDAEPLDDEICDELKTPFEGQGKTDKSEPFQPPFVWNDLDLVKPAELKTIPLMASPSDPAGEEEVVLSSRIVTVTFGASMEDFHSASAQGGLVELEFGKGALSLEVGGEVPSDEDEGDDEDDDGDADADNDAAA